MFTGHGPPDVSIRCGIVPEFILDPVGQGVLYQAVGDRFLLNIPHVARYLVCSGREIIVNVCPGANDQAVQLFLLGVCLGVLLHQRGVLALHASAVATARGALLFSGISGSGKSTLALALHEAGYPVLTDEIAAIRLSGDAPMVQPGNPFLVLWNDAMRKMGVDPDAFERARPELAKYIFPLGEGFASSAVNVAAVYVLDPYVTNHSRPGPIRGLQKIAALNQHTYRPHLLAEMNLEPAHLRRIASFANRTRLVRVNIARTDFHLAAFLESIKREFPLWAG
jgi:hypothetical protein